MHATDAHGVASVAACEKRRHRSSRTHGDDRGRRPTTTVDGTPVVHRQRPVLDAPERHPPHHPGDAPLPRRSRHRRASRRPAPAGPSTLGADLDVVRLSRRAAGPTRATGRHCASAAPFPRCSSRPRRSHRRSRRSSTASRPDRSRPWSPRTEPCTPDWPFGADLDAAAELVRGHPGVHGIADLLRHADGRHESQGETRLARPSVARHPRRRPGADPGSNAVVDFLLVETPVVVEFDGQVGTGAAPTTSTRSVVGNPVGTCSAGEAARGPVARGLGYRSCGYLERPRLATQLAADPTSRREVQADDRLEGSQPIY